MLKDINLANKCGSCCHFKQIENTATGECLQNPYDDTVVHDPKHPHWIVQRSRIKCSLYNAKSRTNADRLRAMSDEKLAETISQIAFDVYHCNESQTQYIELLKTRNKCDDRCGNCVLNWLKQPEGE